MYQIRILDAAARELARLDQTVVHRIVNRMRWLADNLEDIKPEALAGDLAGLYKLRIGDYRVVYEILHSEHVIGIHLIGRRRDLPETIATRHFTAPPVPYANDGWNRLRRLPWRP